MHLCLWIHLNLSQRASFCEERWGGVATLLFKFERDVIVSHFQLCKTETSARKIPTSLLSPSSSKEDSQKGREETASDERRARDGMGVVAIGSGFEGRETQR